jgi:hypothetical protein
VRSVETPSTNTHEIDCLSHRLPTCIRFAVRTSWARESRSRSTEREGARATSNAFSQDASEGAVKKWRQRVDVSFVMSREWPSRASQSHTRASGRFRVRTSFCRRRFLRDRRPARHHIYSRNSQLDEQRRSGRKQHKTTDPCYLHDTSRMTHADGCHVENGKVHTYEPSTARP